MIPAQAGGAITFLFTDIEGSTRLLEALGDRYAEVLADHHRLLRAAVREWHGREVDTQGDAFFITFPRARDAVIAAVTTQRHLIRHPWPQSARVRVRMGLHTGEALAAETGYVGMAVHRAARISAVAHGGQILVSEATQALVQEELPSDVSFRDLGLHRLKDLARPQRLFQVLAPGLDGEFPALRSLDAHPHNLPIQLTSFIGRVREIVEIKQTLAAARLVTLTGAGGAGKTRLALQVAGEALFEFADGAWVVDLASLTDADLVPQTVAAALGLHEEPGRLVGETLVTFLKSKSLLLVLDNCEHLLSACAALADRLLRAAPGLRVLATSREGLGVAGEVTYRIPSLTLPAGPSLPSPEDLLRFEAVRLFYDRARLGKPDFRLTPANGRAIVQIARRLDGIPLAIELAAARVKALSVEQLANRLDDRFRLLTGGSRGVLPRHQTLQAVMDWGYNLLSDPERVLLRRLAVFAGGCTLEAAEAICVGDGIPQADVLDLVTHLVEKSLVLFEEQDAQGRYRMLETVRQYALERLRASGESDRLRTLHRDFYLQQAEAMRHTVGIAYDAGSRGEVAFVQMDADLDNVRAALEWSWANGETVITLRLAADMGPFWSRRGPWSEGRHWLEQTLRAATDAPKGLRARALHMAGQLAWYEGDNAGALAELDGSLALYRELGSPPGIAGALDNLAIVAYRQGDYGRAAALLEESLGLSRASGDKAETAFTLYLLGIIARQRGDYDRAETLGMESLALSRELGLTRRDAMALDSLGLVARNRGDLARAETLCRQALSLARERKDPLGIASSLNSLGLIACDRADFDGARALGTESLTLSRELGDKRTTARAISLMGRVAHCQGDRRAGALALEGLGLYEELGERLGMAQSLERLAVIAAAQGQSLPAARLFAAAESLREGIGSFMPPVDRTEYDHVLEPVRSALGQAAFAAAWAEGRAMDLGAAIAYARKEADALLLRA